MEFAAQMLDGLDSLVQIPQSFEIDFVDLIDDTVLGGQYLIDIVVILGIDFIDQTFVE